MLRFDDCYTPYGGGKETFNTRLPEYGPMNGVASKAVAFAVLAAVFYAIS